MAASIRMLKATDPCCRDRAGGWGPNSANRARAILTTRMRAAIAALPHEAPRLAVTAQITENDIATILDRRIARLEEMKANQAKAVEAQPQVETKPPLARTNDRRFRRF